MKTVTATLGRGPIIALRFLPDLVQHPVAGPPLVVDELVDNRATAFYVAPVVVEPILDRLDVLGGAKDHGTGQVDRAARVLCCPDE